MTYTFESLFAQDFEELIADLASAELGGRYQPFPPGRDGGIDSLCDSDGRGMNVVQCKHYVKSGVKKLVADLRNIELSRVKKIRPASYRIATSVRLSPGKKREIQEAMAPYLPNLESIWGADDINQLLRNHPEVQKAHYKLWLTSSAVLDKIVHHGAAVWDYLERSDVQRQLSLYVPVPAYESAMKLLEDPGYCILTGGPGVGKTTLARVLVARLMERGYSPLFARDDIRDVLETYEPSKKSVILYDDFLGRINFVEKLGKNEDKGIRKLLRMSQGNPDLRVIFTTREYVLKDAQGVYDSLSDGIIDIGKCVVDISRYDERTRARILYNHLAITDLPRDYVAAVVKGKGYRKIFTHKNFSPRLIEGMTSVVMKNTCEPDEYLNECVATLDNPDALWAKVFDGYLDEHGRLLLYVLSSYGKALSVDYLERVWCMAVRSLGAALMDTEYHSVFTRCVDVSDGSLLATYRVGDSVLVDFANPSAQEFVRRRLAARKDICEALLALTEDFGQASHLLCLRANGVVSDRPSKKSLRTKGVRDALRRTVFLSGEAYYRSVNAYDEATYVRDKGSVVGRLRKILEWYGHSGVGDEDLVDGVISEVLAEKASLDNVLSYPVQTLELLRRTYLVNRDPASSLQRELYRAAEEHMASYPSSDEWLTWGKIVVDADAESCETGIDEWREAAENDADRIIDDWIDDANELSDIHGAEEWLDEFESTWSITTNFLRSKLEEKEQELAERDDAIADLYEDEWKERTRGGESGEIDRMFDRLL